MDANEGKAALRELVVVSARRATGTTANGERRCAVCVRCVKWGRMDLLVGRRVGWDG